MARSRFAPVAADESAEIVDWYRDLLDHTPPPTGLAWEPVKIGPTWQWDNGWVLPEATLGWEYLAWCGQWLRAKRGGPWKFTAEQARFELWFYSLESDGSFAYHSAVLQRLKGWGKDPVAACKGAASMVGPVEFDHWEGDRPVGRENPDAWVQLAAVSQDQTQNTMKVFPGLITAEARKFYGIQVGKTALWAMGDTRQLQAVTSSPLALEGARPTLVIQNEVQNWLEANDGHAMAGVIDGNATKSEGAMARVLSICNAYRPGEDSVGQRVREGWEATQGDDAEYEAYGLLYDSLEAPPDAPLTLAAAPDVIRAVRGDAIWLDVKRIVKSIADPANPPSESRRKWYNQITATEDAWVTPQEVDALPVATAFSPVDDEWALFFDGSKSHDTTGVVAYRLSDGCRRVIGSWARPPGMPAKEVWRVPRDRVREKVREFTDEHRIVAFYCDPSHALDDEDGDRYWDVLLDEWHRELKDTLEVWADTGKHAVMWDMTSPQRVKEFTEACGRTLAEIQSVGLVWDGDGRLRRHMLNARRSPNRHGISIAKRTRDSKDKIDLAVCMVGAGIAGRAVLNKRTKSKRTGEAYIPRTNWG